MKLELSINGQAAILTKDLTDAECKRRIAEWNRMFVIAERKVRLPKAKDYVAYSPLNEAKVRMFT